MDSRIPGARSWPAQRLLMAALALTALVAGLVTRAALAPDEGVPRQIPYRGVLEQNGTPVPAGSYNMEFELFVTQDATVVSWSELQTVNVVDGRFGAQLGAVTAIPRTLLDKNSLFLGVKVNGQALAGRQQLLTAPYAHRADSAWTFRSRDITTDLVPPGTIVAFGGTTAPAGWLACDGALLARADYQPLFDAIGTTWGAADASHFYVPDLRGLFLRGADEGVGRDPGRAAGSYQAFATSASGVTVAGDGLHDHSAAPNSQGTYVYGVRVTGGQTAASSDNTAGEHDTKSYFNIDGGTHAHSLVTAATETRPDNMAVKYIIKY